MPTRRTTCLFGGGAILALALLMSSLLPITPTAAQPTTPDTALDNTVQLFFDSLSKGNTEKALTDLFRNSPMAFGNETMAETTEKTDAVWKQFGDYRGHDWIDTKTIGNDLVLVRYLTKFESHPVVWTFTFYRTPPQGMTSDLGYPWKVIGVRFDVNLDVLLLSK